MSFENQQKLLILLSFLSGLAIFIWLGKIIGWDEIGKAFTVFNGAQALIIVSLSFLIAIFGNYRWQEILKDLKIKVSFRSLFKAYVGGYSMMYLFPMLIWGGEGFRVYSLSKTDKINWQKSLASVVIERVLEWTMNIFIIFIGIIFFVYYKFDSDIPPRELLVIFGLALLFFVSVLSYFYSKALRKKSIVGTVIGKLLKREVEGDNKIMAVERDIFDFFTDKKSFLKGIALSLIRALIMQLRVWLLIMFLGSNIGFSASLSILGFTYVSSLIPIPTSLGSHEAIQFVVFKGWGLLPSMATAFTMIIRASEILVASLGLIFLIRTGFNLLGSKINYDK